MIEVVYKEEQKKAKGNENFFKIPNNIRQIGDVKGQRKIYMEDYAYTFLKKISRPPERNCKAAILFGSYHWREGNSYLFIRSALELTDMELSPEHIVFSDKIWGQVYEESKKYFPDQEIVGWFVSFPGFNMQMNEVLLKTHLNHFSGNDKVLFVMEPTEQEDAFFAYENNQLSRQNGYYIYYEKNESMQSYMIEKSQNRSIEETEQVPDRAVLDFRRSVKEKAVKKQAAKHGSEKNQPARKADSKKQTAKKQDGKYRTAKSQPAGKNGEKQEDSGRIPWAACVLAAAALLVVGLTYYRNYRALRVPESTESAIETQGSALTQETSSLLTVTDSPTPTASGSVLPGDEDTTSDTTSDTADGNEADNTETPNEEGSTVTPAETPTPAETSTPSEGTASAAGSKTTTGSAENKSDESSDTENAANSGAAASTMGTRVTGATEYTIKRGDTLTAICRSYYGSIDRIEEVCQLNGISMEDIIYAGQKLLLPD